MSLQELQITLFMDTENLRSILKSETEMRQILVSSAGVCFELCHYT